MSYILEGAARYRGPPESAIFRCQKTLRGQFFTDACDSTQVLEFGLVFATLARSRMATTIVSLGSPTLHQAILPCLDSRRERNYDLNLREKRVI